MRVGVLTGGGDCPGLNAVLRAIARKAERSYGDVVYGFLDGWRGLVENDYEILTVDRCRGILPRGGTILGTSRQTPYNMEDGVARSLQTAATLDLDALIGIGGEGTLAVTRRMGEEAGLPVVGVPKTIDNDIAATEMTFGFDTAVHVASSAIDRLHTTAESHDRVMVVEVMGRHVGHIAVRSGIAGGSSLTLIPEYPFDIEDVCSTITRRHARGPYASIVVVAEGAMPAEGTLEIAEPPIDAFGHRRMGGIGQTIGAEIERRTGIETRVTTLGHVQRGGTPTAFDRILASRYGIAAIDAVHDGAFGQMVALQCEQIVRVSLDEATAGLKYVSEDLWSTAQEFFG